MSEPVAGGPQAQVGVVAACTPPPPRIRRLQVILINPSQYDDDGYVVRYVRGVMPSNTLATLAALTDEVARSGALGAVKVDTLLLDEHVQTVRVPTLARRYRRRGVRPVVALCGVQTAQFPRAVDLARRFRAAGMAVMIGGFHVSGSVAMSDHGMPPDLRALTEEGITLVKGEVEDCWGDLLRDALHGSLRGFYDIQEKPDLAKASIPTVNTALMRKFAYSHLGTIDAGRGCPFDCSFCTIINVQGRRMRARSPAMIREQVLRNAELKIDYYFFTDDNFSRNPDWEGIFDALIDLRLQEKIAIQFMMQVDVLAYRIPRFAVKAAEAGCSQVFIGMETLNPANLAPAGKRQNRVEDYRSMIDEWHDHGVACHVGYIIGFPFDTPESVRADVARLRDEIGVDQASFFMLTPIPGSRVHRDMIRRGEWMEADYNQFDSFHPTTHHPRMTAEEWFGTFRQAWRDFYTTDAMKTILGRAALRTYWGLFMNFAWYKYATIVENAHPMICGFFRLKDRKDRRPGTTVEGRWAHARRRARETVRWYRETRRLYFEMQEVWLATRGRAQFQAKVERWRRQYDAARGRLNDSAARASLAWNRQTSGARTAASEMFQQAGQSGRQAGADFREWIEMVRQQQRGRERSWRRVLSRLNPLAVRTTTRAPLDAYWHRTYEKLRRGRIFRINPLSLAYNALRDLKLCARFNLSFLIGYGK